MEDTNSTSRPDEEPLSSDLAVPPPPLETAAATEPPVMRPPLSTPPVSPPVVESTATPVVPPSPPAPLPAAPALALAAGSPADALAQLERMRADGLITQQEYLTKREAILAQLGGPTRSPTTQAGGPARKDKGLALIIQIVPALFGIYGLGWFYIGDTNKGLMWLIGGLIWDAIALGISLLTVGFGLCLTLPVAIALVAITGIMLNNDIKLNPHLFN